MSDSSPWARHVHAGPEAPHAGLQEVTRPAAEGGRERRGPANMAAGAAALRRLRSVRPRRLRREGGRGYADCWGWLPGATPAAARPGGGAWPRWHARARARRLQEDPPAGVSGAPSENNIMVWNAVIFGWVRMRGLAPPAGGAGGGAPLRCAHPSSVLTPSPFSSRPEGTPFEDGKCR